MRTWIAYSLLCITTVTALATESPTNNPTIAGTKSADICEASAAGDVAKVETLLKDDPSLIKARDSLGGTPLHLAAVKGHTSVVNLLLEKGADVNAKSNSGVTPLHSAAYAGNAEMVTLLLASGADVTISANDGSSAMKFAQVKGNTQVTQILMQDLAGKKEKMEAQLTAKGLVKVEDDWVTPEELARRQKAVAGRIGSTIEQALQKYGPTEPHVQSGSKELVSYTWELRINEAEFFFYTVTFYRGKAYSAYYEKWRKNADNNRRIDFSAEEMMVLLKKQSDAKWENVSFTDLAKPKTSDGKLEAFLTCFVDNTGRKITALLINDIKTKEEVDRHEKQYEQQKSLKDLKSLENQ